MEKLKRKKMSSSLIFIELIVYYIWKYVYRMFLESDYILLSVNVWCFSRCTLKKEKTRKKEKWKWEKWAIVIVHCYGHWHVRWMLYALCRHSTTENLYKHFCYFHRAQVRRFSSRKSSCYMLILLAGHIQKFIFFFFILFFLSLKAQRTKRMRNKMHTSDQQKDDTKVKWETIEKYIKVFSMETTKIMKIRNGVSCFAKRIWVTVICYRENGLVPLKIDFDFSQYEKNEMTEVNETNIELIAEMYDFSLIFLRINIL